MRCKPQFSIRSMLIGTLILCVALACWEYQTREARRQSKVTAEWMDRGVDVFFNDDGEIDAAGFVESESRFKTESLILLKAHPAITVIQLDRTCVSDADLAILKHFPNLATLTLNNTSVTDSGMSHLASLENLQILALVNTKVSDSGLERLLESPSLRGIDLENTRVSQERVDKLRDDHPEFGLLY
jgi:hypothetical protein